MRLTTIGIIKILPFDVEFKEELLASYDNLPQGKKLDIEQLIWDTYDLFYNLRLQENIELALEEAGNNREKIDPGFYKRVSDLTQNEMMNMNQEDLKNTDLLLARKQLAEMIKIDK